MKNVHAQMLGSLYTKHMEIVDAESCNKLIKKQVKSYNQYEFNAVN